MTIVINGRNQIRRTQKANVDFAGGACFDKFGTGLGVWHSVLVAFYREAFADIINRLKNRSAA